jgi:hypothetical protein
VSALGLQEGREKKSETSRGMEGRAETHHHPTCEVVDADRTFTALSVLVLSVDVFEVAAASRLGDDGFLKVDCEGGGARR